MEGRREGRGRGAVAGGEGEGAPLLLLAFTGLVVLEPIEDVLALDLAELAELGGDLLDLPGIGGPYPASIQHLQYPYLLLRRIPPRPSWVRLHLLHLTD